MNIKISYSKEADKFLKNNQELMTETEVDALIIAAIKRIFKIDEININLKKLRGKYKGHYRIRKGNTRIIFLLKKEIIPTVLVKDIDFRGNVYK